MTLENWGGVKQELLLDTNRAGHAAFVARIPAFLQRAMQRIHFGAGLPLVSSALRIRGNQSTALLAFVDGVASLPVGFLEADRLSVVGQREPLHYVIPVQFHAERSALRSGCARRYTIESEQVSIDPPLATATGSLVYWAKFPQPSADSDTNWLMQNAPSVLIDALRIEAYQYLRNSEMTQTAFASYQSAVSGLAMSENDMFTSGGHLAPQI